MAGMLPKEGLTHADLYRMRMAPDADQAVLAPMEHRAFAREWAEESPVAAGLSLPFAIPAYTAAKALGLTGARSPASLDEMFAGYRGLAEGMLNRLVPSAQAHHEESETVQRPDGRWVNVYGRRQPRAGQQLPGTPTYGTVEEAVQAARQRSAATGKGRINGRMIPRTGPLRPKTPSSGGVRG